MRKFLGEDLVRQGFHQIPVKDFPCAAVSIATLANQSWSLDAHVWCVGQYARIKSGSMCLCGTSVKHSGRALGVSRVERQTPGKVFPGAQCECFKIESLSESKCASPERLPIFQILSGANEDGHLTLTQRRWCKIPAAKSILRSVFQAHGM